MNKSNNKNVRIMTINQLNKGEEPPPTIFLSRQLTMHKENTLMMALDHCYKPSESMFMKLYNVNLISIIQFATGINYK
jgi:hypothetical protein